MAATCAKNSLEGQADMRKGASAHAEHVDGQEGLHSNIPALDDAKLSVFGVDTCVGISLQVCLHKVGDGGAVAPVARGVQCARLYLPLQHDFGTQQVGIRS